MTNIISLRAPFYLSCKFMKLSQPCVVMTASDGCFDCFTAPIDFEYCLIDALTRADSMDVFLEAMRAFFAANSSDDSSTLALETYGYADFAALRAAAKERLQQMQQTYINHLSDLFTRDYTTELQQQEKRFREKATEAKKLCGLMPEVAAYCAGVTASQKECDGKDDPPITPSSYWDKNYPDVIERMLKNKLFSSENHTKIEALLAEELEKLQALRTAYTLREKLYAQYEAAYGSLLGKEEA